MNKTDGMAEFRRISTGTLTYKYSRDFLGLVHSNTPVNQEYITIPSHHSFAVFVAWDVTSTSLQLRRDSAESIRKTRKRIVVDLSATFGQTTFEFIKQPILQTFSFPETSHNSVIRVSCTFYEDLRNVESSGSPAVNDSTEDVFERRCLSDLSERFAKMLTGAKFADVTLECEGGNLKAHKSILASRSDVFNRMFNADMLEARTNVVKCKFDVATMKALLEYMYSGKLNKSKITSLFETAEYYEIQELKDTCEEILNASLDAKNAISGLLLAHTFGRKKLMQRILDYIPHNSRAVVASDEFRKASKDCSPKMLQVALLIINALANR